ncbi:MAG: hypothetical protein LBJ97_03630 [Mycoplasmataceae bacterium]|jgi:preprotein translocase subunit SecY|nr:hypothetical protein [Mycoplasmataceae bacterium]
MLHTVLAASTSQSVNYALIIGLSILIALPFISSSIIIPILLAIHKRKTKYKQPNNKKIKNSYKKVKRKTK